MKKKPVVWYVDDLPENLDRFEKKHSSAFEIKKFSTAEQVLSELSRSQPDALLCDIFFYETPQIAEDMERRVREKAEEIKRFGQEIGATEIRNLAGVDLIRALGSRFKARFPVYAYTSKGPYLLDNRSFDHIGESGARWLSKGRYSPSTEQIIIQQDIEEFQNANSLTRKIGRYVWVVLVATGILGGLFVWFLTEILPKWL